MKKSFGIKTDYIVAIFFVFAIFGMLFLSLFGLKGKYENMDKPEAYDTAKEYPLADEEITNRANLTLIDRVKSPINKIKKDIEYCVTDGFYYKMPFVIAKKAVDKAAGINMSVSLVAGDIDTTDATEVVLPFGEESVGWIFDDVDISEEIDNTVEFGKKMQSAGRNFIYFQSATKFQGDEVFIDYSRKYEEQIKKSLEKNNLEFVGFTELIEKDALANGKRFEDYFYKTDHHWKASTGIWATNILCDKLNERFGYDIDTSIYSMDSYDVVKADRLNMGSLGKKVTSVYIKPEEFDVITPKYDTDLDVFMSASGKSVSGSIQDTMYNYEALKKDDIYSSSCYSFYGYENQALVRIHNNQINDGRKVLLIKTSFANCVFPYLAASVEDLDVIDLRMFDGSLETYIKETNPDTVIVFYGLSKYEEEEIAGGCFDFR